MVTQPFGGRDELVKCGYCRRRPFRGNVEHKVGCPCEKTRFEERRESERLYERGYRQSYNLFGLCFDSNPSYKLGWETGKQDLENERIQEEIEQARYKDDVHSDADEDDYHY